MPQVPYLDLKAQYAPLREEILAALEAVCDSTAFAQGPTTKQFEQEFAAWCGVKHCVSVNSGTSALHLAMRCLDIGPGDEVITTPFTFIATAWAISYVGASPVFVDIDPERRCLNPEKLEAAITSKTKAIMPVHLFGMPADMEPILAIADQHGLPVVEDAAQAHGATYKGKRAGQFGSMAGFSFYPGKNLGAYGEGGAFTTNDDALALRARSLREHGARERYYHDEVGYNYRMDSFQGAVLSIKLKHLDAWTAARREKATRYHELLKDVNCKTPSVFADSDSVWHCYVIEVERRDRIRDELARNGISTAVHYPVPLHLQKAYAELGHQSGDFPVSENLASKCLSLPIYPELSDEQMAIIVEHLRSALNGG